MIPLKCNCGGQTLDGAFSVVCLLSQTARDLAMGVSEGRLVGIQLLKGEMRDSVIRVI